MKTILAILLLVVVVVLAPMFLPDSLKPSTGSTPTGLPWEIRTTPDGGSVVFGLEIGRSTLGDAAARFGPDVDVAIVATPDEVGTLEAFIASAQLGFVTGKLILTADLPTETIAAMRERAAHAEYMDGTTRKARLTKADLPTAMAAPLLAIGLIPSVNLDEQMVLSRFGAPAERVRSSDHTEHLLYPDKGLDVVLDSNGKELLQYVAPRAFARLRAPLESRAVVQSSND
jgi:hypothetical protein